MFFSSRSFAISFSLHILFALSFFLTNTSSLERKLTISSPALPMIEVDLSQVEIQKESVLETIKKEVSKIEKIEKNDSQKTIENPKIVKKAENKPAEIPTDQAHLKTKNTAVESEVARPNSAKNIESGGRPNATGSEKIALSFQDALRVRIRQCWMIDPTRLYPEGLLVQITAFLQPDGSLSRILPPPSTDPTTQSVITSAVRALETCAPFSFLPPEHYAQWKEIEITFDPTHKTIR